MDRDEELAAYRALYRRWQETSQAMIDKVLKREDLIINGVRYRPVA